MAGHHWGSWLYGHTLLDFFRISAVYYQEVHSQRHDLHYPGDVLAKVTGCSSHIFGHMYDAVKREGLASFTVHTHSIQVGPGSES